MSQHIQPVEWQRMLISCQNSSYHFNFTVAHIALTVDVYEHDTIKLSFEYANAMPPLLAEFSEQVIKKTAVQLAKYPGTARRISGTLLIDKMGTLHIAPCYPEKPLVIEVQEKLELCPASETRVYALSLANIRLNKQNSPLYTWNMIETPKKTLYGDPTSGVVSYTFKESFIANETKAVTIAQHCPLCVVHPLHIINRTDKTMPIKELLVNFPQLSIFDHHGVLMSETIRYEYNGSSIQISTEQLLKHKNYSVIQKPSITEPSFVLQGLHFFKNMVGF